MKSILIVILSSLLIGCIKAKTNAIVGKWESISMSQFSREGGIKMTYIFSSDGRLYTIRLFADGTEYKSEEIIYYSINGNEITYTQASDNAEWKDRFNITGDILSLTTIKADGNKEFINKKYSFKRSL